jgi:hypothetical protein
MSIVKTFPFGHMGNLVPSIDTTKSIHTEVLVRVLDDFYPRYVTKLTSIYEKKLSMQDLIQALLDTEEETHEYFSKKYRDVVFR